MPRSSDLVPFLTAPPPSGKGVTFRQGVVISWDPDSAANVVQVGDSLLTNLPILNTSEASLLVPGDVVGILVSGSTWAIMGRFTYPGTPEAVSSIQSITSRIKASSDGSQGSRNSTSYGDLTGSGVGPAVTIRIGSSGRALVFWAAEIGQTANYNELNTPHVGVEVSGASSVAPDNANALNVNLRHPATGFLGEALSSFWIQCATFHLFTGLTPGDNTFTLKYRHDTMLPAGAVNFEAREIAVFAL